MVNTREGLRDTEETVKKTTVRLIRVTEGKN